MTELKRSAQRVQDELDKHNFPLKVITFDASTRTSQDAANVIGCHIGQIAKSLVFKGKQTGESILVIASGSHNVDQKYVKNFIGEKLSRVDADYVLEVTGYAIGGIPPIAHKQQIKTYIDEELFTHQVIWGAAGTPNTVFELTPAILKEITKGTIIKVVKPLGDTQGG